MTDVISKSNHQNSHSHLPAKSKRPLAEQYQTVLTKSVTRLCQKLKDR